MTTTDDVEAAEATAVATPHGPIYDIQQHLAAATAIIKQEFEYDELGQAVFHLLACAEHAAGSLSRRTVEEAQLALNEARGAVVAATYAVRRLSDQRRRTVG